MSNLGWYQILTTIAKKVGGPKILIGLFVGGGILVGGGAVAGGNVIKKIVTENINKKRQTKEAAIVYTVITEGKSNEGLLFEVGDTFKVLETDRDAGLIEKSGDKNNPYFVSLKFLETISNYRSSAKERRKDN
ncbi:hypothetical protein [Ruminococcus sp.]|uniref:hypothetical protein n=1 Tax=Ruminococcus sp. TaxID=41978 RepID=UPI00386B9867